MVCILTCYTEESIEVRVLKVTMPLRVPYLIFTDLRVPKVSDWHETDVTVTQIYFCFPSCFGRQVDGFLR